MEKVNQEMYEFIEEITKLGGKYDYLNNTEIVADAYQVLRNVERGTDGK